MAHNPMTPGLLEFVAARFKALGEPARLRILDGLRDGPRTVTQVVEETQLRQANVSKHLAILRSLGLVDRRREGAFVYFSIADARLSSLCDLMCDQTVASPPRPGLARASLRHRGGSERPIPARCRRPRWLRHHEDSCRSPSPFSHFRAGTEGGSS